MEGFGINNSLAGKFGPEYMNRVVTDTRHGICLLKFYFGNMTLPLVYLTHTELCFYTIANFELPDALIYILVYLTAGLRKSRY